MDSRCGHGKVVRMRVEDDRISNLPDDLIHKILSFIGLKLAVQTSALSSRWRYIWTSLPYLNFSSKDFSTLPKFANFVKHFISRRNNLLEVSSVKLTFRKKVSQVFVKRIMDYAFAHNAQQLTVRSLYRCANDLSISLFSSQSLKSLTLHRLKPAPTWDLPSLTTLYLDDVTFDDDEGISHISKCANLKNLTLHHCHMEGSDSATVFDIHLPELINLTLEDGILFEIRLNVFAPKLENLTVIDWEKTVHIQSISKLDSLVYKGLCSGLLQIFSFGLCLLEKVDLCICSPCYKEEKIDDHNLVALLRLIQNAKYITLNLDLIQHIFSFRELILHEPSPFANLKHLKVYPHYPFSSVQQTMPIEVKNYFLGSSPCATFTLVSYEEMKAVEHATSAQKYMVDLQMLLEQQKMKCETYKARINWSNASMEANMNEQGETHIDEEKLVKQEMSRIRKYCKTMSVRIQQGEVKINRIFFALTIIESQLRNLPAPTYDRIQERFSSLRAEAYNVIKLIMDGMKIKCDGKQGCSSVCLHELTTP